MIHAAIKGGSGAVIGRVSKNPQVKMDEWLEAVWEPSTSHWMGSMPRARTAVMTLSSYSP